MSYVRWSGVGSYYGDKPKVGVDHTDPKQQAHLMDMLRSDKTPPIISDWFDSWSDERFYGAIKISPFGPRVTINLRKCYDFPDITTEWEIIHQQKDGIWINIPSKINGDVGLASHHHPVWPPIPDEVADAMHKDVLIAVREAEIVMDYICKHHTFIKV